MFDSSKPHFVETHTFNSRSHFLSPKSRRMASIVENVIAHLKEISKFISSDPELGCGRNRAVLRPSVVKELFGYGHAHARELSWSQSECINVILSIGESMKQDEANFKQDDIEHCDSIAVHLQELVSSFETFPWLRVWKGSFGTSFRNMKSKDSATNTRPRRSSPACSDTSSPTSQMSSARRLKVRFVKKIRSSSCKFVKSVYIQAM